MSRNLYFNTLNSLPTFFMISAYCKLKGSENISVCGGGVALKYFFSSSLESCLYYNTWSGKSGNVDFSLCKALIDAQHCVNKLLIKDQFKESRPCIGHNSLGRDQCHIYSGRQSKSHKPLPRQLLDKKNT